MNYLAPEEALRALANGKVLGNDMGTDVVLEGSLIVMRYTMGRNQEIVSQNYNGAFDKLFLYPETEAPEEENAS